MKYLLDTCVLSETAKPCPQESVVSWLSNTEASDFEHVKEVSPGERELTLSVVFSGGSKGVFDCARYADDPFWACLKDVNILILLQCWECESRQVWGKRRPAACKRSARLSIRKAQPHTLPLAHARSGETPPPHICHPQHCDNINFFRQVGLDHGVLTWPNGVDIAPEEVWQDAKR